MKKVLVMWLLFLLASAFPLHAGQSAQPTVAPEDATAFPGAAAVRDAQAADESGVVMQPAPLTLSGDGDEAVVAGPETVMRNPFQTPVRKIIAGDYGKTVEHCQLKGIIRVGGRQVALFAVASEEGGKKGAAGKEQLRRVAVGDQLRVMGKGGEHVFTVRALGNSSAVIVGENNEEYKVWL